MKLHGTEVWFIRLLEANDKRHGLRPSQENLLAKLHNAVPPPMPICNNLAQANAKVETLGYNSGDVYLHTSPLCHVGGLVSWLAMLQVGARHVFMPKYSRTALLRLVPRHRVTAFIAVPAMIVDLLGTDDVSAPTLSCS